MCFVVEIDLAALSFVCALVRNANNKQQPMSKRAFMSNATGLYLLPEILLSVNTPGVLICNF